MLFCLPCPDRGPATFTSPLPHSRWPPFFGCQRSLSTEESPARLLGLGTLAVEKLPSVFSLRANESVLEYGELSKGGNGSFPFDSVDHRRPALSPPVAAKSVELMRPLGNPAS